MKSIPQGILRFHGGVDLKRALFIMLILFVNIFVVFAQDFENESEYYPKTLWIDSIYSHKSGYRVDYLQDGYKLGTLWIPNEWLSGEERKGSIAYGRGDTYPYITFFFKGGEISHFRLYIVEDRAHASWDKLDPRVDYSGKFASADLNTDTEF